MSRGNQRDTDRARALKRAEKGGGECFPGAARERPGGRAGTHPTPQVPVEKAFPGPASVSPRRLQWGFVWALQPPGAAQGPVAGNPPCTTPGWGCRGGGQCCQAGSPAVRLGLWPPPPPPTGGVFGWRAYRLAGAPLLPLAPSSSSLAGKATAKEKDGLTAAQRKERDAKALQEKIAKKGSE